MKKIFFCIVSTIFFSQTLISQQIDHINGGVFSKRIEYNLLYWEPMYNLDSKRDYEKLFWGNFNAPVEFFFEPSFSGSYGFRMVRDTLKKSYALEFKYITNFKEAQKEAESNYPEIGVSDPFSLPKDTLDQIRKQNQENGIKRYEEMKNLCKIESRTFPISDYFSEILYKTMVSVIDNFKARGVAAGILDGYSVTFRTVVEDEVWSLRIHMPNGNALKMCDLCKQIVTDANKNELNESLYIKNLNEILSAYARNQKDSVKAITSPDQLPQFPGGEKALLEYLAANIHRPEVLYSSIPMRGNVMVRFVVSETGKIGEIEITRSLNPKLDAEVIRVVQSMPDWIPGKKEGKNVPVYFALPVRFQ